MHKSLGEMMQLRFQIPMKKIFKITGLILLIVFLGIQFVPVDRTNPPEIADSEIPDEVKAILKAKCYDCHSNEVTWPWYSYIAPISWKVAEHVKDGRGEVNYSKWDTYSSDKQEEKAGETFDEVLDGDMPIESYLWIHRNAKVTEEEIDIIDLWSAGEL
ncbi:MAG: heme-binding domain-containing protein [Verrucomicrobia bacterium]|nr:heme-binding domain-containing protein [Verrucomicrobiota bacterium]